MHHVRMTIEYCGSGFHGWQWQPGQRTIQGELTKALETVLRVPVVRLMASGRTDAGVHARAQEVSFSFEDPSSQEPDLRRLTRAVSSLLRGELSVLKAEPAAPEFDARRSTHKKQYSYQIINRSSPIVLMRARAWHVHRPLDVALMQQAAAALVGTFDFSSFRGANCTAEHAVREILESEIIQSGEMVIYRVVGRGFLKHMVRNIVGTLVDMGRGKLWTNSMLDVLSECDRRRAGVTAPPWGLYLDWVRYEEFS